MKAVSYHKWQPDMLSCLYQCSCPWLWSLFVFRKVIMSVHTPVLSLISSSTELWSLMSMIGSWNHYVQLAWLLADNLPSLKPSQDKTNSPFYADLLKKISHTIITFPFISEFMLSFSFKRYRRSHFGLRLLSSKVVLLYREIIRRWNTFVSMCQTTGDSMLVRSKYTNTDATKLYAM